MRRLITFALIGSVGSVYSANASEILPLMKSVESPIQLMEKMLCPSGTFSYDEARKFLFNLRKEVKEQCGIDLNLETVVQSALEIMAETKQFSGAEIEIAREFYSQLIGMQEQVACSRESKHKHRKDRQYKKCSHGKSELILPDNMAWGFVSILGGSLMCILPFGITQGIGVGLISGGIGVLAQAAIQGERAYYVESE